MGFGTVIHYFGTFLLLLATILMIVVSISPPAVDTISLLHINYKGTNHGYDDTYFGVFGWCHSGPEGGCSGSHIGYSPADQIPDIDISSASEKSTRGLTHAFILHPVAAVVSFIAFLFSLKTGFLNIVTTLIAVGGFLLAIINLAIDFSCFVVIRRRVNRDDYADASFGPAIWLVVVAALANLAGAVIVFITCCAGRRRRKYENRKIHSGY